ncbi:hypothetical protein, partial [Streptomyces niveus]
RKARHKKEGEGMETAGNLDKESVQEKGRFSLPEWTPSLLIWTARIVLAALALFTLYLVAFILNGLHGADLPWWVLLIMYCGIGGFLARIFPERKRALSGARSNWQSFTRRAQSLV